MPESEPNSFSQMIVLLFFLDISKLFLFIFEIYLLGGYFLFTRLVDSILISIQLKSNFVINANFSNASAVISIIQVKFSFLSLLPSGTVSWVKIYNT